MQKNAQKFATRYLIGSALVAASTQPAMAQTTPAAASAAAPALEEITVTAQRRSENIQSVPVAVTVIPAVTLQRSGTFDPTDLGRISVGLNATAFNGDRSNVVYTIRGQSYTTGTLFPAVVPYFAEVPDNKLLVGTFFDLENVQTLRGPQGTLFGRVTDGGAILIQPAKPTDQLTLDVQGKLGNYDLRAVNGALNIPIIDDKLAIRGAFEVARRRGYTHNLTRNVDLDGVHYESYRFSVKANPTATLENITFVNYTHANETGGSAQIFFVNPTAVIAETRAIFGPVGAAAFAAKLQAALAAQQAAGPRDTYNDTAAFDRRRQLIVSNITNWHISEDITARAILGYVFLRQQTANDYDGTAIAYSNITNPVLPAPLTYQRQLSGEGQLQGKSLGKALDWTIGTYFDRQTTPGPSESESVSLTFINRDTVQYLKTTSSAVYGQASYALAGALDGLKLIGGLRYTHDTVFSKVATYLALVGPVDRIPHGQCLTTLPVGLFPSSVPCKPYQAAFNQTTWDGGIEYKLSGGLFIYGKISKGYRPGGFNATVTTTSYGPENDVSKEIGVKSQFLVASRPVRLNVAGFYDNFTNIQRLVTLSDASGATTATLNVAGATVSGLESELSFKPIDGLDLSTRWAHFFTAKYDRNKYSAAYIAAACPANAYIVAADASKYCPLNPFARTPKDTVGLTGRYTIPISRGSLSFGADWYYAASQYFSSSGYIQPETHAPAYNVTNADITWKNVADLPIELSVFGTNVFNKTYINSNSAVSQLGSLGITNYSFGPPRMYGVSLRYHFGA